ncbi:MAG: hypothetical protein KDA65_03905 [Planctomycetaceae bacterium]|nr:hypothetical protein [Planctomycetaceae bacterium]
MSFTEIVEFSLFRACLISLLSMLVAQSLQPALKTERLWQTRLIWGALLAPFFCPDLLVGYAYYNFSLSLVHHPVWNEWFYGLLVTLKTIPLATILLYFSPPSPLSAEAFYCRELLNRSQSARFSKLSWWCGPRWLWWVRGPGLRLLPAGGLVFLIAFQEFEICTLMNTTAWTLNLFDRRAIGWESTRVYQLGLRPLGVELLVLLIILFAYLKLTKQTNKTDRPIVKPLSSAREGLTWAYLAFAFVVILLIPVGLVFRGSIAGWTVFLTNSSLLRETGYACGFAAISGVLAHGTAVYWVGRGQLVWWSRILLFLVCLPGLCGSFLMSLTVLELFQKTSLYHLYDTPLPLITGLYLFVLPRAVLIQFIRRDATQRESTFLAKTLRNSPVIAHRREGWQLCWEQNLWPQFWCLIPVCFWTYFDMTTPSILASPATTPAPYRLYNLMHYGQGTGLSAMLSATIAAPCLFITLLIVFLKTIQWIHLRRLMTHRNSNSL